MFDTDIRFVKGVGEKRAEALKSLGIDSVDSLLEFFPRSYENWSVHTKISDAVTFAPVCIKARITTPIEANYIRKNMVIYKFAAEDDSGTIFVTLFNTKYLADSLIKGEEYLFFGKVEGDVGRRVREMNSPKIRPLQYNRIHPIYPSNSKISTREIERIMSAAVKDFIPTEALPEDIIKNNSLCPIDYAIRNIHFPESNEAITEARKRLSFEEMFVWQCTMTYTKLKRKQHCAPLIKSDALCEFTSSLPFGLTNAQKRVIDEALCDMRSGMPMNRLVQGDVGCGKTAVAAALVFCTVKSGYQAALMAPTEVLAEQHFETFKKFFANSQISVRLLTGHTPTREKTKIKNEISDGSVDLLIGTHAIIESDVTFKNLALTITDEQHRFGVEQRSTLVKKGDASHTLVMSATPIPRTLALIVYGELDISRIDEKPSNRQAISTYAVNSEYHERIYRFLKKHLDSGRQCYIVCPLVEEGENSGDLIPVTQYYEYLSQKVFKDYNVGILYGKMKPKEKDETMKNFSEGEIQLLVSTTVIEVGIDVPNATVMVIENADRFGLSQLHQLRGRIGRGEEKSTCILVSDSKSRETAARLKIMCETADGFVIADEDLKMRGPGDFLGHRQHGLPEFKVADLVNDIDLFKTSGKAAAELIKNNFKLEGLPELQRKIKTVLRNARSGNN